MKTRCFYRELLIMVNLLTICLVTIAAVDCTPMQELELDGVLEMLEKPQKQEIKQRRERGDERFSSSLSSDYDSEYDDEDENMNRVLRNTDVIDIIQKSSRNKGRNSYNLKNREDRDFDINGIPYIYSKSHNGYNKNLNKDILEKLLQDRSQLKYHPRQQFPDNRLASKIKTYDEKKKTADLSNYSKIFIVLNPLAIQKSNSEGALNNLISKLLSTVSSNNGRQEKSKSYRYEALEPFLNNLYLSRRARKDSIEVYSPRDSMEEYKGKRSRNDRGGGGAGRTAIPYIGHRGDIYERDN